jgi:hypothetical protein
MDDRNLLLRRPGLEGMDTPSAPGAPGQARFPLILGSAKTRGYSTPSTTHSGGIEKSR